MSAIPAVERMRAYRARRRSRGLDRKPPSATLLVTCWCEAGFVRVPVRDVREGRTRSCGAPTCRPAA